MYTYIVRCGAGRGGAERSGAELGAARRGVFMAWHDMMLPGIVDTLGTVCLSS